MTVTAPPSWAELVDELTEEGVLSEPWRATFMSVPREVFRVVTPWNSAYKHAGLLSLTVHADGTATGGLVNTTISFMELRDQRIPCPEIADVVRDIDTPEVSDTDIHASKVCNDDMPFGIAFQVPSCHWDYIPATGEDGCWCVWFLDAETRSWARFDYQPGARRWSVHQFGPRRL